MNPTAQAAIQTSQPVRTRSVIMADSSDALPARIELIKAGTWPASSVKGPITITTADLHEFKNNFDRGVGIPSGLGKIPIDFSHNDWMEAAGWVSGLQVEGDTLYADPVEWSTKGASALQGGEYKCISPSFWPACLGEWSDPEDGDITARNVLVGAGLTNIPFFKSLTPIMASTSSDKDGKINNNTIWITADEKEQSMNIDEIRVKDPAVLSVEEKQFVSDHKDDLSVEEQQKFGVAEQIEEKKDTVIQDVLTKEIEEPVTEEVKEAVAVAASIKSGQKVLMDASEVASLKASVEANTSQLADYRKREVEASVDKHVAAGRIVADAKDKWVSRILADATLEEDLAAIPKNPLLASEIGSASAGEATAQAEFDAEVDKAVKASVDAGTPIAKNDAITKVASENADLYQRYEAELKNK